MKRFDNRVSLMSSHQMTQTTFSTFPCRALGLAAVLFCASHVVQPTASAQSGGGYFIRKSTIDSGGGTVTGGVYLLRGTAGQHDAGPASGGDYMLTGGYWSPVPASQAPDPVSPDPSGIDKSRFISFSPPAAAGETALRVKFVSLHVVVPPYTGGASIPFTLFNGQSQFVGPPTQYVESASSQTPFYASKLQCTPHYQDWTTVGLLHVTGYAIVPSSEYQVENLAASCMGSEGSCTAVSAPVTIKTTRWGDVAAPFNPPDNSVQPAFSDIGSLVDKFKSVIGAPIKARAMLVGVDARGDINITPDVGFTHIAGCVDGFKGLPYPHKPGKCATGTAACISDAECTGGSTPPCTLCP